MAPAFFHADTDAVRFWVAVGEVSVGASVSRCTLHHRYCPSALDDDPLQTYQRFAAEIDTAVRRRVGEGALEPVMLREYDLRKVEA